METDNLAKAMVEDALGLISRTVDRHNALDIIQSVGVTAASNIPQRQGYNEHGDNMEMDLMLLHDLLDYG